jgi:hypothetical protein
MVNDRLMETPAAAFRNLEDRSHVGAESNAGHQSGFYHPDGD